MNFKTIFSSVSAMTLLAGCADADEAAVAEGADGRAATAQAAGAAGETSPLAAANEGSILTLAGQVVATGANWFTLSVGQESVIVEMDDWDWFQEGKALKPGDEVTVTGTVDQDIWEAKKLEASSVYVRDLGLTLFASGADEEDLARGLVTANSLSSALGYVTNVEGQEFTVGGISGPVRVDMSQAPAKPSVKVGDRVYAWGEIDIEPRERVEIMADGVMVLSADKRKKMSSSRAGSPAPAASSNATQSRNTAAAANRTASTNTPAATNE